MGSIQAYKTVIRYRGFLLIEEAKQKWLIRPERSPMQLLPFRKNNSSLAEVKAILDQKLSKEILINQAA